MNSKDYGIPQNRERVFIISIRNDIAQSGFCFPQKVPLMWKLKDFLEDNVDEKEKKHQAGSVYNPNGISPTLTDMSCGGSKQPFVLVKEGTKKGYAEAKIGDSINISYPNNINKRGRVG